MNVLPVEDVVSHIPVEQFPESLAQQLPDIPMPKEDGVVMDVQYDLQQFGKKVLRKAEAERKQQ